MFIYIMFLLYIMLSFTFICPQDLFPGLCSCQCFIATCKLISVTNQELVFCIAISVFLFIQSSETTAIDKLTLDLWRVSLMCQAFGIFLFTRDRFLSSAVEIFLGPVRPFVIIKLNCALILVNLVPNIWLLSLALSPEKAIHNAVFLYCEFCHNWIVYH